MIRDLERERPAPRPPADVCIVGAGAAGIILAVELLAQGKRVILLEAGGQPLDIEWNGQIQEFDARDFEPRQSIPESGWPFSKAELAPFYARALELEGLAKVTRKDSAVWQEIGLTQPAFDGLTPLLARFCPEPNLARIHHRILKDDPDLDLWFHANGVELLFEGNTATAVRARTLAGAETHFPAANFVFCLGAAESCRFFLQPRPTGLPWNRSGLLGKHFQNHVITSAATVVPTDTARFHAAFDDIVIRGFRYRPALRLAPGIQDRDRTLNCAATMHFLPGTGLQQTSPGLPASSLPQLLRRFLRSRLNHRAYNSQTAPIQLEIHCEQQPGSASSITLSDERDSLGLLRTRLDWQISDRELASIRACTLQAQAALVPLATVTPDPGLVSGDPAFLIQCTGSNHHAGGMRMTSSPENGVVDLNLCLHGTANCYVCSAAVLPTSGFADPTHTLLALAVRLADHLSDPRLLERPS